MKKNIKISATICLTIVLVACFSLMLVSGQPTSTNSIHRCNLGTGSFQAPGLPFLAIGAFDKFQTSSLGSADVIDFFVIDKDTGDILLMAIVTDSQAYKDFYVPVFQFIFSEENIILVEPNELNVWTKGSDIYAELTVPVEFNMNGEEFTLPPFTAKFESFGTPSHQTNPPSYLPSGWSYIREVWRDCNAVLTFNCPDLGIVLGTKSIGSALFNVVDIFVPSPPA